MESALDRFAQTRGAAMLGLTSMGRQWKFQSAFGGGLLVIGGLLASLPLFGAAPEIVYGALGPGIAGAVNLGIGLHFRNRVREQGPEFALSDEATTLLRALVARAQVWQNGWRPRHAPMHGPHAWPGYRAPMPPSEAAMEALDRAAAAHNRVSEALGETRDERANRLRSAIDAGMGEALHQAAMNAKGIEETVARLEELANLVEATLERPEVASPLRSNLEATIEELKAEAEAVRELRG